MHSLPIILCLVALGINSALALSARNAQVMATLKQIEALLNKQLLSEIVQQQEYDEVGARDELIAAIQRACNKGSGSDVQSLAYLADMLSRDEVTTQEAVDIIQAQGLFDILEGATKAPVAEKVLEKIAEEDLKSKLDKPTLKKVNPKTDPAKEVIKKEIVKELIKNPLFDVFARLNDIELANKEDYDLLDNVGMESYDLLDDVGMESYDLLDDVGMESYDLLDDVGIEGYSEAAAQERVYSQVLDLLKGLMNG